MDIELVDASLDKDTLFVCYHARIEKNQALRTFTQLNT